MNGCLIFTRGKEVVTVTPVGDKCIFTMALDTPESGKVMTKLMRLGFLGRDENGEKI